MIKPWQKKRVNVSPFSGFRPFVTHLQSLINRTSHDEVWAQRVKAALDGEPSAELRRAVSPFTRRRFGTYFTGSELRRILLEKCLSFDPNALFYDPTCGVGDLLLETASQLPLGRSVAETIAQWGKRLAGTDIHAEFIAGAKHRLVLMALQRHQIPSHHIKSTRESFPMIRVANCLSETALFESAKVLLMNPPFGLTAAPSGCNWAGGRITASANFVMAALERVRPTTQVLAILPEVLRSGSFTENWRRRIVELADVQLAEPYGIFDDSADVDVFVTRMIRRESIERANSGVWPSMTLTTGSTVGDFFNVHVGRVVPHRDPEVGPEYAYIHPRCVPAWTEVRRFVETRKHPGKVYRAPFVAIRRTSRPGHPFRATASVVAGKQSVAVENHFIVCAPKDQTLRACRDLQRQLKTEATNAYLDQRIRCRHLTVGAVRDIPFVRQNAFMR